MHLVIADKRLKEEEAACLIYEDGNLIYKSNYIGVKPLLVFLEQKVDDITLGELVLVDKVIGKAALLIAVHMGIKKIYTPVASEMAHKSAESHNALLKSQKRVPYILNRARNGMCPIEESVLEVEDTDIALKNIRNVIKILMAKKNKG